MTNVSDARISLTFTAVCTINKMLMDCYMKIEHLIFEVAYRFKYYGDFSFKLIVDSHWTIIAEP